MDAIPVFLRQIHDVGTAGDSGVVDDDVETAEFTDRGLDHLVDVAEVRDVGLKRQRAAGCCLAS